MNAAHAAKQEIQAAQYRTAYHWGAGKVVDSHRYERITAWMVAQITHHSCGSKLHVLDFGCGDGRATFLVWEALRAAGLWCRVTGLDISADAIHWARERTRELADESLQFSVGRMEDGLDRLNATPDQPFIVLREVIEHLPDDQIDQALQAIAAQCPSATLCASVPSTNSPVANRHFRHYDVYGLRSTFERNGFACEPILGFGLRPRPLYRPLRKLKSKLNRTRWLWRGFNWLWRPCPPGLAMTLLAVATPQRHRLVSEDHTDPSAGRGPGAGGHDTDTIAKP